MERLYLLLHETLARHEAPGHPAGGPELPGESAARTKTMTIDQPVATRLEGRSLAWRLGASATFAIAIVLLTWALTVDFTKVSYGFFSDGATYYSLAHSIADDFDFEYRKEDLVRVWREFPSGPEGIFLKRGRDIDVSLGGGFPFVHVATRQDPDQNRLYYGKSYIFPLFAAPFVFFFGTNGFLVMHAVLITLVFLAAYAFLVARSHPIAALVFAFAYVFVSVAPVYMIWMTPDFFNLAMVAFGYFFWCYKDVVGPNAVPLSAASRVRWFLGNRSDAIAAIFIGIATFSKPTHVLLIAPLRRLGDPAQAVAADPADRRVLHVDRAAAVRREHRHYRRVELPGRRPPDVLQRHGRVPVPDGAEPVRRGRRRPRHRPYSARRADRPRGVRGRVPPQSWLLLLRPPHRFRRVLLPGRDGDAAVPGGHARSRGVAMAHARGGHRFCGRAASLHAVHILRRRRTGRQPLLPRRLPGLPVPDAAAADRGSRPHRDGNFGRCSRRRSCRTRSTRRFIRASTPRPVCIACCRRS